MIALARGNEAARVVDELGIGWTVAPDDVDDIADALRGAIDGRLADDYTPRDLDRVIYPAPAHALAGEIERAIAERGAT